VLNVATAVESQPGRRVATDGEDAIMEDRSSFWTRAAPWLLLAWAALALLQIVTPLWYPTPDACCYLSIARSLAGGGPPTNLGSRNLIFGIGYPLVISPAFVLEASPFLLVSAINAGLAGMYLAAVVFWTRRRAEAAAWPVALIAVGNAIVLAMFRRALSEAAFMAVLMWFVVLLPRFPGPVRFRDLPASAGLLFALVLIRPTGIVFAAGWALLLALQVRAGSLGLRRAVLAAAVVILPATTALMAGFGYSSAMMAHEHAFTWSNLDVFTHSARSPATEVAGGSVWLQCVEGLRVRINEVGRLTVPGMFGSYGRAGDWRDVNLFVYVPLFGLLWFGWWKSVREQPDAYLLAFPLYFVLHVYWPFDQAGRYFAPLVPLLLVCFWRALAPCAGWRLPAFRVLVIAHIAVALGHWLVLDRPRALRDAGHWAAVARLTEPIEDAGGTVQTAPGLDPVHLQLQFLLDRPVVTHPAGTPVPRDVRWLVLPAGTGPRDGFVPALTAGPYQLLRRTESE
jgi:hypothetical protein